ncbi:hypothetical protein RhiirC2_796318 [Rhizophagus irregularis]|uniref:HAT C-terminal dimerisation domain-containing protein n=1 Tax=Rhizophagus irregularis TaxID=588596 RepID=A0A2N1M9X4_9GLOM|nr:hypothetical protein RhiirC2_796318 [Rhizophagus irregularis]
MNISGGGLKRYCETRWTSSYETINSVVQLQMPLEKIKIENPTVITNASVKKILSSRGFFHDCNQIARILEPLRNTVLFLERNTTTLADCFIMLVQLAVKINKIPHEVAYWLHPNYRGIGLSNNMWSQIAKYASSLLYNSGYKSKNAASKLIANMADFKCKDGIYSLEYDEFRSPQIWWKFVDNNKNNNQLQNIALKLFAIVSHSASCERNFLNLG